MQQTEATSTLCLWAMRSRSVQYTLLGCVAHHFQVRSLADNSRVEYNSIDGDGGGRGEQRWNFLHPTLGR